MLMTARQLQQQLGSPNLVVFDCRFSLADREAGRNAYLAGHIPGAFYLDLEQDLSGQKGTHGGRHPLPNPQELAAKLGAAGVDDQASVVVYDDGGGMAARAWWLIRYLGHEQVAVLDGGWKAWLAAGGAADTGMPKLHPTTFPLDVREDWVLSVDDVMQIVAGERAGRLVDARAAVRYRGEVEPLDPKAGHIPGAANLPWESHLQPDGTWKPAQALREAIAPLVQSAGDAANVVNYCGSGVTACANVFALALAGFGDSKLYAGSWSDWCSYDDLPVATGEAPGTEDAPPGRG
ncbi:sulfurtransferase [Alicyclobacillus cycloheptanicus]|uniref:Thiosulfate/3-mercaptopyruvate sulfurtransferase n=1 Tax=Alicyclobacillus cycloheptanicus TaxID=1457 RepID=A0ABT9XI68_9BACL|nr:sulfurtransferase [Alicyclobacillus cycloheptanicus]MDQ0190012.1 thiosulfate/3-mercaptopyruvate sulfurtransferase [Alicyclobacillus cycloheptanicus]WDM00083.1 sulfurtransferase [Alicyclobacillus cycloheptanicus]